MEQTPRSPRFTHKLALLQQARQKEEITVETYQDQLTALIEEELQTEVFNDQTGRRAQLWTQAEESWKSHKKEREEQLEKEKQTQVVLTQKQPKEELHKTNQLKKVEDETLQVYADFIERVINSDLPAMRQDARNYRFWYNIFQSIVILGSITATTIVNIEGLPRWVTAIFSGIVGATSGFMVFFKFKDRSFNLQKTADLIEHEYHLFELRIKDYNIKEAEIRYQTFATRLEDLQNEQRQREQLLEQSSDLSTQAPSKPSAV
jgi:Protein of unknown function (DUF4231)